MAQTATSAGWRYSRDENVWRVVEARAAPSDPVGHGRSLRLATLNCLHDLTLHEVLQHEVRHGAICRELRSLDADVIGLNEVTRPLLERVLREDWVRNSYTTSVVPDHARCSHVSTVLGGGSFGNVLLSRVPPSSVEYIEQPGDGRHSHVISLCLSDPRGGGPLRAAVCSAHFTACPWLMEGRRKVQLEHVTSALTTGATSGGPFDVCVVMGDFNFHREAENASIPQGWGEVPAVVALGETWDFGRNAMLAHYLPLRNVYNGLDLGATFGWPSPMRLDRMLVHGSTLDCGAAGARIFADEPIDERARGRPSLPQTGRQLQEAHRSLPWQEYLYPSDHFGILVELPHRASSS
jgi:endonuclease/exonuclease/phosphatase family metal-dependent hydrolase